MTVELVTAIGVQIIAVLLAFGALWQKIQSKSVESDKQLIEIHSLVNSRLSDATQKVADLERMILGMVEKAAALAALETTRLTAQIAETKMSPPVVQVQAEVSNKES